MTNSALTSATTTTTPHLHLSPAATSSTAPPVVRHFEEYVCQSPELSVPVAAIKALTRHIEHSPATTMTEFSKDLDAATGVLLKATNQCIAVAAGCDLFRRFVNRTGSDSGEDLAAFRARLIAKGDAFVNRAPLVRDRIAIHALEFVQDDSIIMCHSYSRVVLHLLLKAAAANRRFTVLVTESRPTGRGVRAARLLNQNGVPASVILDSAVGHYMGRASLVLVGAEGVVENGGIVNQIGTFMLAVMAKAMGVPFYAVVESFKFVRCFPLSQYDLPSYQSGMLLFPGQQHNIEEAVAPCRELESGHPSVDYTPPVYISLLLTDIGILTPSGVSDELIRLYNN